MPAQSLSLASIGCLTYFYVSLHSTRTERCYHDRVRQRDCNIPLRAEILSLAAASLYVGWALVSGNSSAGVGFVVALLHSETRPFLDQVSPKSPSGVYRESR